MNEKLQSMYIQGIRKKYKTIYIRIYSWACVLYCSIRLVLLFYYVYN